MTLSSAAMVPAASAGTVAARPCGRVDELFAEKFAQVVGRLADGALGVGCAGSRVDLRGELADGEAVRCRGEGQHRRQGAAHRLFVQVDAADAGGNEPGPGPSIR